MARLVPRWQRRPSCRQWRHTLPQQTCGSNISNFHQISFFFSILVHKCAVYLHIGWCWWWWWWSPGAVHECKGSSVSAGDSKQNDKKPVKAVPVEKDLGDQHHDGFVNNDVKNWPAKVFQPPKVCSCRGERGEWRSSGRGPGWTASRVRAESESDVEKEKVVLRKWRWSSEKRKWCCESDLEKEKVGLRRYIESDIEKVKFVA